MTIGPEELARRYCAVGHMVEQRAGPGVPCATHTILARGTWALIQPDEQPMGGRVVEVLVAALEEANPLGRDAGIPVAEGQVGLDEMVPLAEVPVVAGQADLHPPIPAPVLERALDATTDVRIVDPTGHLEPDLEPAQPTPAARAEIFGEPYPPDPLDVPGPADTGPVGDGITPPADRRSSAERQLDELDLG